MAHFTRGATPIIRFLVSAGLVLSSAGFSYPSSHEASTFTASAAHPPLDSRTAAPVARVDSIPDAGVTQPVRAARANLTPQSQPVEALIYLPVPRLKPARQAPPDPELTLYTSRPSVMADGVDAVLVGAVALDANRRALPDGTPVTWTATLGSLTPISTGLANGIALARFVGGTALGEATITVQIGAGTSTARVSIVAVPADPDSGPGVYDEAAELKELLAYLRTAIRRDAAGRLGIDAATHGVAFEVGGIAFTPSGRRGRDSTANFMYQLAAVHAGSIVLPLGNLAAPTVTVQADTLAYVRGSGVVEWYTSRRDGLEQGFTFAALPPLDGDLVIVGAFATRLRPELVSQREGILFREPASGEAVLRYGSVSVTDSAGRRTAGQLELRGNQIAIRVAQAWLAQAVYPVTVDPLLQNDLIFADGFESGDFSAWSAVVTDGGDLSVTAAAALVGTYGMQAVIDDTTRIYARDDTPANEVRYRARFYFDPNAVTMTDNQDHDLLDGRTSSDSVFRVQLKFVNGGYQVRARIRTDAGSDLSTGDYPISDAPHFIEVDWAAATSAGANDGYLSLWIDGVLQETVSGIDNDTLRIEQARLGATGSMEAGIAGTEYFDAFESRRQTYIGPAIQPDFSASPVEGTAPLSVTFTNLSTPTQIITAYLWNLGDGHTSAITNPVHTYTQTGLYTVSLTAYTGAVENTVTKTNAITVTAGATATLAAFPWTPVLDSFADAVITDTWSVAVDDTGAITGFVASGGVLSATQPGDLYWLPNEFGADQEVYYTIDNLVSANGPISLTLKAQDTWGYNRLQVRYDPSLGQASVWSTWTDFDTQAVTVTQHGAAIPVTYAVGDRFGARAMGDGQVEVYKNGARVDQRDVTAWPYSVRGGFIGLGLSTSDRIDDFGGGTFAPLQLNLGASKTEVVSNETITGLLVVRNVGVMTLTNVVVTDSVPSGLSYVAGSATSGGVYLTSTQTLSWNLGALGPSVTTPLQYRATASPITSTKFMTSTGRATAAELPGGVTDELVFSAGVVTTDTIPANTAKTVVSADSRMTVTIPSGVFTQTTPITLATFPSRPAITGTLDDVLLAQYRIDTPAAFTNPVTLTFDLKGLTALDPVTPTGYFVAIGYLEEFSGTEPVTETTWALQPLASQNITDSLFSVQTTHFSTWGAFSVPGEPNGPTKPAPRVPGIDLFGGALTFAYPLAAPPGRGGLQPDLSLMYSSRGADAAGPHGEAPMLGMGWSLDVPQITRKTTYFFDEEPTCTEAYGQIHCFYQLRMGFENIFWLSFNGASHRLIPDPANNGTYYTESDTFLRIRRCDQYSNNNVCGYGSWQSIPNDSKQFWEVTTKDGSTYRFGYTPDSEQRVPMGPYRPDKYVTTYRHYSGWAGVLDRQIASRWRLDLVRDVYGNAIVYHYREESGNSRFGWYDASSYLDGVYYAKQAPVANTYTYSAADDSTWRAQVRLTYIDQPCDACQTGYATEDEDTLRDITTFVNDAVYGWKIAHRYTLNIQTGWPAARLNAITEVGKELAGPALTTYFDYEQRYARGTCGGTGCDRYPNWRMVSLVGPNGLSATAVYPASSIQYYGALGSTWRFYVATQLMLNDGLGNSSIRTYSRSGASWYSAPYVENSPSLGFQFVAETIQTAAGVVLARTDHEFFTHPELRGREKKSRALRPSDDFMLQQTLNTWAATPRTGVAGVTAPQLVKTETGLFDPGTPPLTTTVEYKYDLYGNLWAERQRGGSGPDDDRTTWYTYTYNTAGGNYLVDRVATQRLYAGDSTAEPPAISALAQTLYFYDGATLTNTAPTKGRLTATRTGITNTATVSTGYEATWGNPVVITDARGFTTTIGYDGWGQYPSLVTNALNHSLQLTYAPEWGALIRQIDPNGATTQYDYDNYGRLTKIARPGDSLTSPTVVYTYTDNYVPYAGATLFRIQTAQREASGQPGTLDSAEFYNGLGQLVQTRSEGPQANQVLVGMQWHDARGLVVSQTLPYTVTGTQAGTYDPGQANVPGYNRTGYDALGRTTIVTAADGTTATTTYQGFTTIAADALGRKRQSTVDAFGQLTQVVEYTGTYAAASVYATTVYTYDLRGNLAGVRDALGNTTAITYDDLGRKVGMFDPDMGTWRYRYDAAGNIISQTDALAQSILFGYDALGRLVTKTYQSDIRPTAPVTYTYDQGAYGIGRRTGMSDGTGSQTFAYDVRGRPVSQTRWLNGVEWPYTVAYGYDNLDRQTTLTYPDGEVVTTTYNTGGLPFALRSVTFGGNYVTSLYYNANGQVTQMGLGNGLNTTYTYFPLNFRLKTIQTGSIQNLSYEYDRVGNVLAITDTATFAPVAQTQRFTYDPLDRLVGAQATGAITGTYGESYTYDPIGNLLSKGGAAYQYADPLHKHAVTAIITNGQTLTQTYDANGNMLQRVELSGTQRITYEHGWDAENRLTVVTNTVSGEVTKFVYDGDGMRVAQIAPDGTATVYIGEIYEEVLPPGMGIEQGAGGGKPLLGLLDERLAAGAVRLFSDAASRRERMKRVDAPSTLYAPPASRLNAGPTIYYSGTFASYADFYTNMGDGVNGVFDGWMYSVPDQDGAYGTPHAEFGYQEGGTTYVRLMVVSPNNHIVYPTIGKNDLFTTAYTGDGVWFVKFAYRYPASGGYGSSIGIGTEAYTNALPHTPSCSSSNWENVLHVHQHDTAASPKYSVTVGATNVISSATTDTSYHTVDFVVAGGKYYLRYDEADALLASGALALTPGTMYLGNCTQTGSPGSWQSVMFDYVRAGDPETNPPTFAPKTLPWSASATQTIDAQVRDSEAGLETTTGQYRISTSGGSSWSSWQAAPVGGPMGSRVTQTITATNAGPFVDGASNLIQFRVKDIAGNTGQYTYTVRYDGTGPTLTTFLINNGATWTNSRNVTLTLSASDSGSGVSQMRFCNDGSDCSLPGGAGWSAWESYATTKAWTLRDLDGTRTVSVTFRDAVNNTSQAYQDTINLDRVPPTGGITIGTSGYTNNRNVTLNLWANDSSGMSGMRFQNDGGGWSNWEAYATTKAWTLADADGLRRVSVQYRDVASNTAVYSDTIVLDRVPPPLTVTQPLDGIQVVQPILTVKGLTDPAATVALRMSGGFHPGIVLDATGAFTRSLFSADFVVGANTLVITATDPAQNVTIITRTVNYDPVGPQITDLQPLGGTNQTTPRISARFQVTGTAAISTATALITVSNVGVTSQAIITPGGFAYTPTQSLSGAVAVHVQVADTAGNLGQADWTFSVDTSTWLAVEYPKHTQVLNTLTTIVSGTTEAGATVTLTVNTDTPTQTTAADGYFLFADMPVVTGANALTLTAVDALGNQAGAALTVTVNLNKPWADVRARPEAFSTIGCIAQTTFVIDARPPLSETLDGWRLDVLGASGVVTTSNGPDAPPPSLAWDGDGQPEGVYTYTLVVTATNGEVTATPYQNVFIDNTPPDAPVIDAPNSGITVTTWQAWFEGQSEPGSTVTLLDGGYFTNTLTQTVGLDGRWWTFYPLHGGLNEVYAVATDATCVASPASNVVTITQVARPPLYTVGVTPTTVAAGGVITLWATARHQNPLEGAPTVGVWAEPPDGSNQELTRTATLDNDKVGLWEEAWPVPGVLPSDDYPVFYQGIDLSDTLGTGETGLAVRNVPAAPIITWPAGSTFSADPVVNAFGTVNQGYLTVRLGDGVVTREQTLGPSTSWGISLTLSGDGAHVLRAQAVDRFGQVSSWSNAVTVTLDTTPPVVNMGTLPAFTNAACVDVSWQGEDAISGIASYDVGVQQDGGAWTLWQAWVDLTSLPYCPASNGMYGFRARARDLTGNESVWPATAQVTTTVDRTPPQATLALSENSAYAHVSGDRVYYKPAGGVFTVTATMTDTPAGLQQVVFPATVSAGGSYPLNGASSATVSHSYAFTPSSTESGLDFPVTVSDRAGNVVTATFDVERDATAPAVTVNVPARIYTATIPVSWTVSELGAGATGVYTVSVMTDTGPLQLWLSGVTSTSASLAGELGHRYTFVVTTTDNVSNVGQGSAETIVTQVTKYYYIGSSRVAMRQGSEVTYLHADHLGTVSLATNASQAVLARTLNLPYGSVRWSSGTMPTDWGFTGQRETGLGLTYMHARYYASFAGRFISADTIVPQPGNPQSLNRFSYVGNSPLLYIDPTGHDRDCAIGDSRCRAQVKAEKGGFLDLRRFGLIPGEDIDPLVYEFYFDPTEFDVTASVEYEQYGFTTLASNGFLAQLASAFLGQGRIPDRPGEDEHYPVKQSITYNLDGAHQWLRGVVVDDSQFQIVFNAKWTVALREGQLRAMEIFDLRPTFMEEAIVVLEPSANGRSLTWRSTEILISPNQDHSRYIDAVKLGRALGLDVAIRFTTRQAGPNTIQSQGQLIVNGRVQGRITFDGVRRSP